MHTSCNIFIQLDGTVQPNSTDKIMQYWWELYPVWTCEYVPESLQWCKYVRYLWSDKQLTGHGIGGAVEQVGAKDREGGRYVQMWGHTCWLRWHILLAGWHERDGSHRLAGGRTTPAPHPWELAPEAGVRPGCPVTEIVLVEGEFFPSPEGCTVSWSVKIGQKHRRLIYCCWLTECWETEMNSSRFLGQSHSSHNESGSKMKPDSRPKLQSECFVLKETQVNKHRSVNHLKHANAALGAITGRCYKRAF